MYLTVFPYDQTVCLCSYAEVDKYWVLLFQESCSNAKAYLPASNGQNVYAASWTFDYYEQHVGPQEQLVVPYPLQRHRLASRLHVRSKSRHGIITSATRGIHTTCGVRSSSMPSC